MPEEPWTEFQVLCRRQRPKPSQRKGMEEAKWLSSESCSVVSDSLQPHELQHTRPPCPSPTPRVHSNSCPSSQWCHPAISSCYPLLLLPPIPLSIRVFSNENSSHEVAKVLEFQLQHHSFQWTPWTHLLQDGLVGSPCSPRDSQESSSTPQFKSINSLMLSLLHSPTLTSILHLCGR